MTTPPHPPPGPGGQPGQVGARPRPLVGATVIIGRVAAIVTLVVAGGWGLLLIGISSLSIMWGPLCGSSSECGPRYWSGIGTGLVGAVVAGLLLVIALPLAWRRPVLLFLALAGAAVLVTTALAVLPGLGL